MVRRRARSSASPTIWPNQFGIYRFGDYALDGNQVGDAHRHRDRGARAHGAVPVHQLGLRMRAVVESPRMTELAGVNADRVSTFSWMLSSLFAGLAGVLHRAAVRPGRRRSTSRSCWSPRSRPPRSARLTSIPMALLGGLLLGIAPGDPRRLPAARQHPRPGPAAVAAVRGAVPRCCSSGPGCASRQEITDPLAGVDPPPPSLAAARAQPVLTIATYAPRHGRDPGRPVPRMFVARRNFWLRSWHEGRDLRDRSSSRSP